MTKIEAWIKWCDAIPMDGTEYMLEKSSHGKAFSYAWDAAVEAEREACAELCEEMEDRENPYERNVAVLDCASAIRARSEQEQPR
jgi:hypothetical protein